MPESRPAKAKATAPTRRKEADRRGDTIVIQQFKSGICCNYRHKRTLKALGLQRMNQKVTRPDNAAIRGMVASIPHLVRILEA